MVLDLLTLGVFKYYGFFVEEATAALDGVGLGAPFPVLAIALPIGISFITFHAISYVVDVGRKQLEPPSLVDLAIYISFFPHLVAGPIVRASEFLPQLREPRDPKKVAVGAATILIVLGLFKKVVVADTLAREVVDPVFAVPEAFASADVLLALYAYAVQVYCDFSGYTDMAIGIALLMGLTFPQNFDRPFGSRSLGEFWRRWHMTLSRFLRDYVYVPLGGARKGPARAALNLWLTMVICGIWHGRDMGVRRLRRHARHVDDARARGRAALRVAPAELAGHDPRGELLRAVGAVRSAPPTSTCSWAMLQQLATPGAGDAVGPRSRCC